MTSSAYGRPSDSLAAVRGIYEHSVHGDEGIRRESADIVRQLGAVKATLGRVCLELVSRNQERSDECLTGITQAEHGIREIAPGRHDVLASIHAVYEKGEQVHGISEKMSETASRLDALIDAAVEAANELHGLAGQHITASNEASLAARDAIGRV